MNHTNRVFRSTGKMVYMQLNYVQDNYIVAGIWPRVGAALTDIVIIFMIMSASFSLVDRIVYNSEGERIVSFVALVLGVLIFLVPGLYMWLFTWGTGRTPGKRFFELSVVDQEGRPLRLGRSFLREAISKYVFNVAGIFFPIWYIGFIWIGFDKNRRGWHDRLSGTYVIKGSPSAYFTENTESIDLRELISRVVLSLSLVLVGLFISAIALNYLSGIAGSILHSGQYDSSLDQPLDPTFYLLGDDNMQNSKDEWQRILKNNDYVADIVPVGTEDISKELILFIPGHGLNFQDIYTISNLEDSYQVLIIIYDKRKTVNVISYEIANAIEDYTNTRYDKAGSGDIEVGTKISIIGHSLGGTVGTLALSHLSERGFIGGIDSTYSDIRFITIDAPWRGIDVPKILTLPGVKHVVGEIMPLIPVEKPPSLSGLTLVNGTTSMNAVLNAKVPNSIDFQVVSVVPDKNVLDNRNRYPVDGWYSVELSDIEVQSIWDTFSREPLDMESLSYWMFPSLTYKQDIQQLFKMLERDSDYIYYLPDLFRAAKDSKDLEEFKMRYDSVISNIIDTFHGEHTHFMWEDKTFIEWLRNAL